MILSVLNVVWSRATTCGSVLSKLGRELRVKERLGDDRVEGEMEREWGRGGGGEEEKVEEKRVRHSFKPFSPLNPELFSLETSFSVYRL